MFSSLRWSVFSLSVGLCCGLHVATAAYPAPFELNAGDRVVFLGDTLIEQEQYHGWVELMLTSRFKDRDITFRNLGWSADTPAGDSRFGLSLLQAGREPANEGWLQLVKQIQEAKPTVLVIGYGMASSFEGAAGLAKFREDYRRLMDVAASTSPGVRFVLLSPVPHESLGTPWPDPAAHNEQLATYSRAIQEIAGERGARFIPLFDLWSARGVSAEDLTHNGIHLTSAGYRAAAETLAAELFGAQMPGAWRTNSQAELLRQAIVRKNEWFFHRSRPANMAYIFGFRKREQGRNAAEVLEFDRFIAAEEKRIAQLRTLQPSEVPVVAQRIGNLNAVFTPQPHPEFEVAEGFEVTLWAENPLLHKPVQMNFDAQGRLWVVSSELYPQIEPGQAATDKIIILEDTKHTGRADRATVFADGLVIPTGVEIGDGGAYVAQSTELLHFSDTDGDGKADVRRTVLSGFGTEDTHHNLHTLRWGPDGRLYMNQSVYTRTDTETPHGVVRLKAGGVFRFDPRDQRLEVLYRGWVNSWGHQFDDFGQSFLTDGAGNRGISWGLPGATYQTLAPARRELQSISAGNYPKFCGIEVVRSGSFPADWQGDLITCDFRAHRIVRFKVADQGAGFRTIEMPDLIRTTADTFRPIDARFGPDGALYIADWSNPIIQHGEVDFRDPRRDKSHGRIWRIAAKTLPVQPTVNLTELTTADLLNRLLSVNGYDEEQARHLLVERGSATVLPELQKWIAQPDAQSESARLQALWLYQAFNQAQPALLAELLSARDHRIRAAAVRAMPAEGMLEELSRLVLDEHPRVRAEAVRALGKRRTVRAADLAFGVLATPMDPFLEYALWLTINELAEPWLAAVQSGAWTIQGREQHLEYGLRSIEPPLASEVLAQLVATHRVPLDDSGPWFELIGTAGGPKELRWQFDQVLRGKLAESAAIRALSALGDAARLRGLKPEGALDGVGPLLTSSNAKIRLAAVQLAGFWKMAALQSNLVKIAGNPHAPAEESAAAFAALRDIGGTDVMAALTSLARSSAHPNIRQTAAVTLARLDLTAGLPEVVNLLAAINDEAHAQALWRDILSVKDLSGRLADKLAEASLPVVVARAGLRPAREGTQHQALVSVLMRQAGLTTALTKLSPLELQQIGAEALAKGDAARGEQLYRRPELACVVCHAIGGAGGKLGPDLTSIGASAPPDYLVESLLFPNAKIKEGYHSVLVTTNDGRELSGMITQESATEVILRDAANVVTSIPVSAITARTSVGSLMPAGLLETLLPEERLDLINFLAQLGKPGAYDAAMGGVSRVWKLYAVNSRNEHIGAQRVTAGDFSLQDWTTVITRVDGSLPAEALTEVDKDRASMRGLFAAATFRADSKASVEFTLSGNVSGAWLNGRPLVVGNRFTVTASPGVNTLVFQIPQGPPAVDLRLSGDAVEFAIE